MLSLNMTEIMNYLSSLPKDAPLGAFIWNEKNGLTLPSSPAMILC